jgi:hypothetical protein
MKAKLGWSRVAVGAYLVIALLTLLCGGLAGLVWVGGGRVAAQPTPTPRATLAATASPRPAVSPTRRHPTPTPTRTATPTWTFPPDVTPTATYLPLPEVTIQFPTPETPTTIASRERPSTLIKVRASLPDWLFTRPAVVLAVTALLWAGLAIWLLLNWDQF